MKRKVLAVDVDLTVVDSLTPWLEWYKEETGHDITEEIKQHKKYKIQQFMTEHHSPLDWWKIEELYHNLEPYTDAQVVLEKLSEHMDIVFVSASFPEHMNSKKEFCGRHFPYMKGFIASSEKGFINADYFVDDHFEYLLHMERYNPNCKVYMHRSEVNENDLRYAPMNWKEIFYKISEDISS